MRKSCWLVCLVLACIAAPGAGPASAGPDSPGSPGAVPAGEVPRAGIEAREIEETIRLLEDPVASRRLAEQLRVLLEARRMVSSPGGEEEAPESGRPPIGFLSAYATSRDRLLEGYEQASRAMESLVDTLSRARAELWAEENRQLVLTLVVHLLAAVFVGLAAWLVLKRITRRWEERIARQAPSGTTGTKLRGVFLATFLRLGSWIGIGLAVWVFLLFLPVREGVRAMVLWALVALGLSSGLRAFLDTSLCPEEATRRLFPLEDRTAAYLWIWSRRLLAFSLWMVLLLVPCLAFHRSGLAAIVLGALKVGWVVFVSIILAQWKESMERALRLQEAPDEPAWKRRLKGVYHYGVGKLYLLAVLWMGATVGFSLFHQSRVTNYLLASAGRTLLVVLAAVGLWFLWRILFGRLFDIGSTLKQRYPDLEEQVDRYVSLLGRAGYGAILLVASLNVLNAWGIDVFSWLGSHGPFVKALVKIPLTALAAVLLVQLGGLLIRGLENEARQRMLASRQTPTIEVEKRVSTLGRICRRVLVVVVGSVAGMMILAQLGLDIKPVLAGAGIVGLAVGFGAQNLVRDIISGMFLIVENRIRVGDVAILNGTGGLVEQVNLRTTVLRGLDGTVHVFPNGAIQSLSNMTHEFSYYLFNVGVAYKEDVDRVMDVLRDVGREMTEDPEYKEAILEPLEILGVDEFGDSAVVIKARIKTLPIKQWAVGREMNRRIKKRFDQEGIEIPFPHRTFYFGEASPSISVKLEGWNEQREEIKKLVREVLQENRG